MAPQQPATGQQPATEQPAQDTRNAGQVIVDILVSQGRTCEVDDANARWVCTVPGSTWPETVQYVPKDDGQVTIWFDSFLDRAFARPCAKFVDAINDLNDPASSFTASCDDTAKNFRLNTAVVYGPELDVMAWVQNHEAKRADARNKLNSIHAIAR
jgi:hypothetical protein